MSGKPSNAEPDATAAGWEPPHEFDDFRIERLLGAGGMGRVYLARDRVLERAVAVKFIAAERPDPSALERFLIEARAVARLQHPNVVAIYRVGQVDGRPYVAGEFVPGESLAHAARPMAWRDVLRIGLGLTRGLAAAQGRGILHRDIKPANIMMSDGEVKLVDFGIAKLADEAPSTSPPMEGTRLDPASTGQQTITDGLQLEGHAGDQATGMLTRAGTVLGTPRYLAPELWYGARASARSDVFSLGVVLFELCAGADARRASEREPGWFEQPLPPVRSLAPEVPEALARVIDRCVAIRADARYDSAREVRDALEQVAAALDRPAPSALEERPQTRFTRVGDVSIAYQVIGDGPTDLVMIPGFVSHLEVSWEEPSFARFLRRLATHRRLILLDKRGTGLSDRVDVSSVSDRMEDVRAVMDAAGSERATVFGMSDGGALAALVAASYPERTRSLIVFGASACTAFAPDFPHGMPPEVYDSAIEAFRTRWGQPIFLELEAPSRIGDEVFARWWARYLMMSASPASASALLRANQAIDIRHLMPAIRIPTLVMHRTDEPLMPIEGSRDLAARIPGAKFVEIPGTDHLPFTSGMDEIIETIERFLAESIESTESPTAPVLGTVVVSVPATGVPADAALRRLHADAAGRHGGSELGTPDGAALRMVFDGPARALRCALALAEASRASHVPLAIAVHTAPVSGTPNIGATDEAVVLAERIAALARPGEVLVSRTVHALAGRSGLAFEPRPSALAGAGVAPLYVVIPTV